MSVKIVDSAQVDPRATIGDGSSIWDYVQIREDAVVGEECIVGRSAYIGSGVVIGNRVKIQNNALIYEPAVIEDGVFIGPAVVLTNDLRPRAINPDGSLKSGDDWDHVGVTIKTGAAIGACSVCVAPVTIGSWAMVAAGSTVTKEVPSHALVAGAPAKQIGWVGRSGERLERYDDAGWRCPTTGEIYQESANGLILCNKEITNA